MRVRVTADDNSFHRTPSKPSDTKRARTSGGQTRPSREPSGIFVRAPARDYSDASTRPDIVAVRALVESVREAVSAHGAKTRARERLGRVITRMGLDVIDDNARLIALAHQLRAFGFGDDVGTEVIDAVVDGRVRNRIRHAHASRDVEVSPDAAHTSDCAPLDEEPATCVSE